MSGTASERRLRGRCPRACARLCRAQIEPRPPAVHAVACFSRTATAANIEETIARGKALWASIYEPHAEKLWNKLGSYHPDFIGE